MRITHFMALAAVALFVAFGPPERTTPAKWALVVGVGDYIHFGDEIGGDLPGAANDARAVADVLVNRYGFEPENVKLVLDHAATRDRLVTELSEWLPSVARPGDLVWFYFAGHGSQAWDMDGDEDDGLDETVCPADVMRGNTEMDILDDEINTWLGQLPTDNVVVVWDKCHAKSSTRAVTPFARPRSLDRRVEEDVARPDAATAGRVADAAEDGGGMGAGVLEIAAAQADEVAIDAAFPGRDGGDPVYGGAFTTPFVQNLWNADAGVTYEEIFNRTRDEMRRKRFRQQPDIGGLSLKDRPLFWAGDDDEAAATAAPVGGARILDLRTDGGAVLAGGSSADMTPRSLYTAGGQVLEVVEVERDRGTARIAGTARSDAGAGESLAAGEFARLVAYRYPEARLHVSVADLDTTLREGLRDELGDRPALRLIEADDAFSHLLVRPRDGHLVVLNLDGFPRDSVAAGPGAASALARLLEREYGQFQLAELENPAEPFDVRFAFGNGRNDFELGEQVSFNVSSERDGYLTIVDLAPDGTVSVIFPNEHVSDSRLRGGQAVTFPDPATDLAFQAIEPIGRGIVRAFVTERPLVMPFGAGADATEADRIWAALRDAAGPSPVEGSEAIPLRNWATAAIVYEIRRR